jgi:hypothetical protein
MKLCRKWTLRGVLVVVYWQSQHGLSSEARRLEDRQTTDDECRSLGMFDDGVGAIDLIDLAALHWQSQHGLSKSKGWRKGTQHVLNARANMDTIIPRLEGRILITKRTWIYAVPRLDVRNTTF